MRRTLFGNMQLMFSDNHNVQKNPSRLATFAQRSGLDRENDLQPFLNFDWEKSVESLISLMKM